MINAGNKFLIEFCHSMARAQQPQLDGEIVCLITIEQKCPRNLIAWLDCEHSSWLNSENVNGK